MWPREHGALVGTWPNGHVALGARGSRGTWAEQMVDLSICCSEHDVSRCFNEYGGTLLMSWRSWPEPGFVGYKPVDEDGLLGAKPYLGGCRIGRINHSAWKPEAGGRDPDPGAGTWKPEARVTSSWNIFPQQFALYFLVSCLKVGNNIVFFIGLLLGCTCARSERIHSLIGDVWPGEWEVILDSIQTRGLDQDGHVDVIVPLIPMAWKWIIRKNYHVGPSKCSKGGHRCCVGSIGQKFDGEAGNICIKGDASAHTPDACAAPDPGILRGRILARLRIRGIRRFNKTQRLKLRIFMLDSAGLACASCACKSCNGLSFRSRTLGHVVCGTQRLDGLSSWNPEAGWTFIMEPEGWMDFRLGTRRLAGLASWKPEAG
ncbi:hypothetical protein DY000_02021839 [Brassica cretica]|uniref:Uncharacterized protein n=1 Tax=Brassica cretica TaxID=69181 RepID=A0ABQ7DZN8_BRACR|nr:hypothetical protein DY000_02021839 [Brassica cretica]